jgi:serine/threonine protein kinase
VIHPLSSAPQLRPDEEFGDYRITRLLGRGGMGEVYAAEHIEHGLRVALKVLNHQIDDPLARARFRREGQLAAALTHPHVVYVYGSEYINTTPVIIMELVTGGTLKDAVEAKGALPAPEAVDAILQVIAGLEAAYAAGILHRDVKPSNCFVERDGTVKVGDFGLSISTQARDPSLTVSGGVLGTPQYASPEQLRGASLTIQSDIYSVGATLFYLLTGRAAFEAGDLMAMLTQVATEAPRSPRDFARTVPSGLAAVVQRCLAKDVNARPRSYMELSEKLRPFGSASATIAPLRSRLAAAIIDLVLITFVFNLVSASVRIITRDATATATPVLWPLLFVTIYFALTEGFGTASPGKWVFGLRISTVEGGSAGFPRGCFRAALFALAARAPFFIPNGPIIDALLPVATLGPMQRAERAG